MLGLKIKEGQIVGKHNGRRIVGIEFGFKLFWDQWAWLPETPKFSNSLIWLCFLIRLEWAYDFYS
jgi:hypothetical protein